MTLLLLLLCQIAITRRVTPTIELLLIALLLFLTWLVILRIRDSNMLLSVLVELGVLPGSCRLRLLIGLNGIAILTGSNTLSHFIMTELLFLLLVHVFLQPTCRPC